jgi:flagellar hook-basal body complex protein FliE
MDARITQAAQLYQNVKPATKPVENSGQGSFAAAKVVQDFSTILRQGEQTAQAALVGKADPQSLVEALAQTQLAVETAVSVRDKIVEAYQEILRMPV